MPPRVRGRYPLPASGTRAWRLWSRYTPSGALWPAPEPPAGTIPAPGRTTSCMTASPALRSRRAGCRTLHRGRATGHDATSPSDPQTWIALSPARGSRVNWKEWHCYRCNASRGLLMRSRKMPHPLVMRQAGRRGSPRSGDPSVRSGTSWSERLVRIPRQETPPEVGYQARDRSSQQTHRTQPRMGWSRRSSRSSANSQVGTIRRPLTRRWTQESPRSSRSRSRSFTLDRTANQAWDHGSTTTVIGSAA